MPMLRRGWLAILPGLVFGGSCLAGDPFIESQRSTATTHGLYEVDQAARAFVASENARLRANWTVADPNPKILVARCSVPLNARWGEIRLFAPDGRELVRKVVEVACSKPVSGESWTITLRVSHAT